MQTFVKSHFLSSKDNLRFLLFVVAAFILIILGAANRHKPLQILPAQNQMIDSKPKQSGLPKIKKIQEDKSGKERA
jgi:hypothetical protein